MDGDIKDEVEPEFEEEELLLLLLLAGMSCSGSVEQSESGTAKECRDRDSKQSSPNLHCDTAESVKLSEDKS